LPILGRVDAGERLTAAAANYHEDHEEGVVAVVEVVATGGSA
jgi:hypothetical protein